MLSNSQIVARTRKELGRWRVAMSTALRNQYDDVKESWGMPSLLDFLSQMSK